MDEFQHPLFFEARDVTDREREKIRRHFLKKRDSGGGECGAVEKIGGNIYKISFKEKEDQERVLQRKFHTISLPSGELHLTVSRTDSPQNPDQPSTSQSFQDLSFVTDDLKVYIEGGYAVVVGEVEAVNERIAILEKSVPTQKELPIVEKQFKLVEEEFNRHMTAHCPEVKITSNAISKYQARFQQNLRNLVSLDLGSDLVLSSLSPDALDEAEAALHRDLIVANVELQGAAAVPPDLDRVKEIMIKAKNEANCRELRVDVSFIPGPSGTTKVQLVGYRENVNKLKEVLHEYQINQVETQEVLNLPLPELVDSFDKVLKMIGMKQTNVTLKASLLPYPCVLVSGPRCLVQETQRNLNATLASLTSDKLVLDGPGAQLYFQAEGKVSKELIESSCHVLIREQQQHQQKQPVFSVSPGALCTTSTSNQSVFLFLGLSRKDVDDAMTKLKELYQAQCSTQTFKKEELGILTSDDMKDLNQLVETKEYRTVKEAFKRTVSKTVMKIERLQNVHLRHVYEVQKKHISDKNKQEGGAGEKLLYHGTTKDNCDSIMKTGFNRSFAGQNATAYGLGTYFAVNASYSANYSRPAFDGTQVMFVARVLTGLYAQGQSNMKVPPARNGLQSNDRYDSVVDNMSNPNMYVVFHDNQAYPDYLITFNNAISKYQARFQQNLRNLVSLEVGSDLVLSSLSPDALDEAEAALHRDLIVANVELQGAAAVRPDFDRVKEIMIKAKNEANCHELRVDVSFIPGRSGTTKVRLVGYNENVNKLKEVLHEYQINQVETQEVLNLPLPELVDSFDKVLKMIGMKQTNVTLKASHFPYPCVLVSGPRCLVQETQRNLNATLASLTSDKLVLDGPGAQLYFQAEGKLQHQQCNTYTCPQNPPNFSSEQFSQQDSLEIKLGSLVDEQVNVLVVPMHKKQLTSTKLVDAPSSLGCSKLFFIECLPWDGVRGQSVQALSNGLKRCLDLCVQQHLVCSVAFTVIGPGILLKFPLREAIQVLTESIGQFGLTASSGSLSNIHIVIKPDYPDSEQCYHDVYKQLSMKMNQGGQAIFKSLTSDLDDIIMTVGSGVKLQLVLVTSLTRLQMLW
ncbi:Poly [ADP-ribose] polymerase 15 [Larimichthys crocea]|uniref:Poly [ADP-ribose] polymerase n=1 Tax=Larimichthys crocea TaxID=215358 RepID=A0A6G0HJB8_LARCR|nr:Poly [ADP-ribose] polymerase 15 [Larimichthys crocea]